VCLLALAAAPAQAQDRTGKTLPQPTANSATTGTPAAGGFGLFSLPALTADEQAQLMSDAMMVAELILGFLGATPAEEELTAAAEGFYRLLVFLALLQKFGEMFAPNSP